MLAGMTPLDYDVAVDSDPGGYAAKMAVKTGGRVVVLGKAPFTVYRVASPRCCLDVSSYKGRDIRADLLARDFSINALACDLTNGRIVDVTGGIEDLRQGKVRMVSPDVFRQDPIRLIRAFRMAATLGFRIDAQTLSAIQIHAGLIVQAAGERIWSELTRILACKASYPVVMKMISTKILFHVMPEMVSMEGCRQNRFHASDVLTHCLQAVQAFEKISNRPENYWTPPPLGFFDELSEESCSALKLTLLLHDIGKPDCRRVDKNGQIRFFGHSARGAELVQAIGRRLRMSNRQREWIAMLIRRHQRPHLLFLSARNGQPPAPRALGRFLRQCGPQAPYLLMMAMADNLAKGASSEATIQPLMIFLNSVMSTYIEKRDNLGLPPLINGRDLIRCFRLSPSPLIGTILRRVQELRLADAITTRNEALDWVADYLDANMLPPEK